MKSNIIVLLNNSTKQNKVKQKNVKNFKKAWKLIKSAFKGR